jgi:integrase
MKRKIICRLPEINDCGGDLNKQWFVYYSYLNPKTNKLVRFRTSEGFSRLKTESARRRVAEKLKADLTYKLKNGYNPFEADDQVIYNDNLKYHLLAEKEGRMRKSNKTMHYYMSKFMEEKKPRIRISTYHTYNSKFRVMKAFLESKKLSGNDISAFTDEHAQGFINYLFETRKIRNKMVNHYLRLFREFFQQLIKRKILNVNPFTVIDYYKTESIPAKYLQVPTIEILKKAFLLHDPQMWLVAQMEFYCMIRPAELRKLQVKNINMFEGSITVPPNISKNGKQRTVVIPDPLFHYLDDVVNIRQYPENHFIISKRKVPDGDPVSKNYLWNHWDKIRKKVNLPRDYKLYSFKHTGDIMAYRAGIGLKDLQMQNGHHSLDQLNSYLRQMVVIDSESLRTKGPVI